MDAALKELVTSLSRIDGSGSALELVAAQIAKATHSDQSMVYTLERREEQLDGAEDAVVVGTAEGDLRAAVVTGDEAVAGAFHADRSHDHSFVPTLALTSALAELFQPVAGLLHVSVVEAVLRVDRDDQVRPELGPFGERAGHEAYERGAGYVAAKAAEAAMVRTLRLELTGTGVRVMEIAPGMVATEEFALNRFGGDAERARAVYDGITPLVAEDIADAIAWMVERPHHVNVDLMVVRPREQGSATKTVRSL